MSATTNQSPESRCSSKRAGCVSAKHKRKKHLTEKQSNGSRKDSRIYIGLAFESWRDFRESCGFRSDTHMALHLLEEKTKKLPSVMDPVAASDTKLKICQSDVQSLIEQEIHKAMEEKERQIQSIIQDTSNEASFETSIQKLENRIDAVARRAEVALSHVTNTQKQNSSSSTDGVNVFGDSGESKPQIGKKRNCEAKRGELLKMMETTRNALKRFRDDNEVLTAAMADLHPLEPPCLVTPWGSPASKELKGGGRHTCSVNGAAEVTDLCEKKPPPCLAPFDSSECVKLASTVKTETSDIQEERNDKKHDLDKALVKTIKTDDSSPGPVSGPAPNKMEAREQMKDSEEMFFYPPLPDMPFPSALKMEAASYSTPQRVDVNLAFIRNPTRISVLWNVEEEDRCAPPMESYTILLTMETFKGSGDFLKWDTYDKLQAKSLPMCALINKFKRGHRLCAAVVGKDIFGRYGPFSKVATAILPD